MINLKEITKIFKSKKGDVIALNRIDLQIPENKFVLIKGHSGCGKSTLLFAMGGMLKPSSGEIEVLGKNPFKLSEKERTNFLSGQLGFVFQSYYLIPYLNVLENIMLSRKAGNKSVEKEQAIEIAKELNLEHRLSHKPSELSIGEKQRVALARALIINPKLILADEPTGNLDPENTNEVLKHLTDFKENGGSVIMVSHSNEADHLADITISMEKGKITKINTKKST
jgi:putative ABC transport system ATP-binding protein